MIQTTHTAITTRDPCRGRRIAGGSSASPSPPPQYYRHQRNIASQPPSSSTTTTTTSKQHRSRIHAATTSDTHIIPNGFVKSSHLQSRAANTTVKTSAAATNSKESRKEVRTSVNSVSSCTVAGTNTSTSSSDAQTVMTPAPQHKTDSFQTTFNLQFTPKELKQRLTPLQYHITQEKGTEREYSGTYYRHKDHGTYSCIVCGEEIFSSQHKYYSGSGWPAFYDVLDVNKVKCKRDPVPCGSSCGGPVLLPNPRQLRELEVGRDAGGGGVTSRHQVQCTNCGSHLGHRFNDGPRPTHLRYCINSAALTFNKQVPKETAV